MDSITTSRPYVCAHGLCGVMYWQTFEPEERAGRELQKWQSVECVKKIVHSSGCQEVQVQCLWEKRSQ